MSRIFDVLIKNTTIIDGSGQPAFFGDIGLKGGRIKEIGKINVAACIVIDGSRLTACPGFIDTHTHIDLSIVNNPNAESLLMQGVTTAVGGHCGISMAPVLNQEFYDSYSSGIISRKFNREWTDFNEWLNYLENKGMGVNYIPLVGHNLLRAGILGRGYDRLSTPEETSRITIELEKALDAGAFGMSASFDSATAGHYAGEEEILTLLGLLRDRNAVFAPHTRHLQNQVRSEDGKETAYGLFIGEKGEVITGRYHGFVEVLEYAERVKGLNMMISHLMSVYLVPQPHPEYLDRALTQATIEEIVDKPRNRGINVTFNVVASSYTVGSEQYITDSFFNKSLAIPGWIKEMDKGEFIEKLRDLQFRRTLRDLANSGRLKFGILSPASDPYWSQCYRITASANPDYIGKTVFEIAREKCPHSITRAIYEYSVEVVCDIVQVYPEAKWVMEWDKRQAASYSTFLRHPYGMPCNDSASYGFKPDRSIIYLGYGISPVAYNCMPSYLVKMVKEEKALKIEEAVRKMTSLPADVLGISDRGRLEEGYWADIVLMDWEKLRVYHDFSMPERPPEGIEYVIVNGTIVYKDKQPTGLRNGKTLRKTSNVR